MQLKLNPCYPLIGALILIVGQAAEAQNTDKVEIILGTCAVQHVSVVLEGKEDEAFDTIHSPVDANKWVGQWKHKPKPFPADKVQASLRLGGKRTDCQPSKAVKDEDRSNTWGWVASFTFRCDPQPVREVDIQTDPAAFPFRYERRLAKSTSIAESHDCREEATFDGTAQIVDLRLNEKIFLKFPSAPADPGLYVHEILDRVKGARQGTSLRLSSGEMVHILSLQRGGNHGGASSFSTVAIDIDEVHVAGLSGISVVVK